MLGRGGTAVSSFFFSPVSLSFHASVTLIQKYIHTHAHGVCDTNTLPLQPVFFFFFFTPLTSYLTTCCLRTRTAQLAAPSILPPLWDPASHITWISRGAHSTPHQI